MGQPYKVDKGTVRRLLLLLAACAALVALKVLFAPHWGAQSGVLPKLLTVIAIFFGVRWVLQGGARPEAAASKQSIAAAQAVLAVLEVPGDHQHAIESAKSNRALADALAFAVAESPRAVTVDWRGMPHEILQELAKASAPFGCKLEAIGEEDEEGWAPFTLTVGLRQERLRARHHAGDDADDLLAGFAKLCPRLSVLKVVPGSEGDTLLYVIVAEPQSAQLSAAAGDDHVRWFAPPQPNGATLLQPA